MGEKGRQAQDTRAGEGGIRAGCMSYPWKQSQWQGARLMWNRSQDLEEVEEWNEFGELHENIGPVPPAGPNVSNQNQNQNQKPKVSPAPPLPVNPTATGGTAKISPAKPLVDESKFRPLPGAAEIAARNNPLPKSSPEDAVKPETMTSAPAEKEKTINAAKAAKGTDSSTDAAPASKEEPINAAKAALGADSSKIDHLSAPPSAAQSGTQTPAESAQAGDAATKEDQVPFSPAIADTGAGMSESRSDTHRGSDVLPLPSQEIKKVESDNAITEDAEEDTAAGVTNGVEGLQVGEGKDVQKQEAGEPEEAGKSVED